MGMVCKYMLRKLGIFSYLIKRMQDKLAT
jgi:hypothetical protein